MYVSKEIFILQPNYIIFFFPTDTWTRNSRQRRNLKPKYFTLKPRQLYFTIQSMQEKRQEKKTVAQGSMILMSIC